MLHKEYVKRFVGDKIDFDKAFAFQCVDLARHYISLVWEGITGRF
jgi:hypothetical protein